MLENVEAFIKHTAVEVRHGGNRAFYSPTYDFIQMPPLEAFRDTEAYYNTKLHELTHATRHETRLNRDFGRKRWGDEGYAAEELVAELGSAFLCADLGITPEPCPDHASYLESWLQVLKNDKRAIFTAAAHAERATAFLHGLQPDARTAANDDDEREAAA
jgi:antirestriction protein ArdC